MVRIGPRFSADTSSQTAMRAVRFESLSVSSGFGFLAE